MAILKRPMFRKGGSANEGIMHGLERRGYADSNWEDLAKAYDSRGWAGSSAGQDTSKYYGPRSIERYLDPEYKEKMIESYTPTEKDWSWLKPKKRKITTSSGEEVWLEGGIPIKKQETVPPEAIAGYKIPIPEVKSIEDLKKKKDVGINGARGYDEKSFESRKHTLSERAKYFAGVLNPHARERLTNESLAAASEALGKSTGNTWQDVANAITAAAKASGGIQDTYADAAKLALMEDIELKGIRETAKAKSLYRDYAPSEKIKSFNELKKHMSEPEAIDRVFGADNIYANVAEASSKDVGVPESSINIAAGQTYKEDYKGQVESGDWEEFKDTAEDGVYKVGKKIYKVQTVEGKKKITVLADFASTKI